MRLYYLTPAHYGLSNLAVRRVKISRFSELNDPFELLAVNLQNKEHRKAFRETRDEINRSNGLISLSRSWKNPLLWGHYAEKHTGFALGFDVSDHVPAAVIYATSPDTIPIDQVTNRPILSEEMMSRLFRTKFFDWKYEDEMRIFVKLDHTTCEAGLYFYDFCDDLQLREVILGPRCEIPIDRVRALVSSYSPSVSVIKSRIAFGSFDVIENKAFRQQMQPNNTLVLTAQRHAPVGPRSARAAPAAQHGRYV